MTLNSVFIGAILGAVFSVCALPAVTNAYYYGGYDYGYQDFAAYDVFNACGWYDCGNSYGDTTFIVQYPNVYAPVYTSNYVPMTYQGYQAAYQYPQQYSQPYAQQSSYATGYSYQQQNTYIPATYGYPTGDTDTFGTPLCIWPGYEGRAHCDSNPRQPVYDPWTGRWY